MKLGKSFLIIVAALSGAACNARDPVSPNAGLQQPVAAPQPPYLGRGASRVEEHVTYNVHVVEAVRSICAGPDPFFAFDSSKADSDDQPTMQKLFDCMEIGPLVGKSILLTGRTDPRGTEDYNEKLGLERAERVKHYLVSRGVDVGRIDTRSIGKEDASPLVKDWPADRRVEIQLASSSR